MEAAGANRSVAVLVVIYLALAGSGLLVWYNLRTGRGDVRGAAKLALLYFACMSGARLLAARHAADMQELSLFWHIVSIGALNGAFVGAFYLAVEPWVRRRWPQTLISWSRFTTKGIRDPLVGRDLLYGAGLACVWVALTLVRLGLHGPAGEPVFAPLDALTGMRYATSAALESFTGSLFEPLFFFFVLFLARVVLRKQWLAAAAFIIVFAVASSSDIFYPWVDWPLNILFAGLIAFILIRFGLLALIAAEALSNFLLGVPRTLDFSQWYAGMGIAPVVLVALIALYGFRISLGGRKLLKVDSG
jgi:serine/threonine-protein kinase